MIKLIITALLTVTVRFAYAQQLEEVKSFGENQPVGVAQDPVSNRLFVSFPHHEPYLYGLTEIVDGKREPFPNEEWNKYKPKSSDSHFVNVQALFSDDENNLWVLDSAPAGTFSIGKKIAKKGLFKLLKISLRDNLVKAVYTFDDLPKDTSALNDVNIDPYRQLAYLSDPGLKAIVVLDLVTGKSRIVLRDDKSMLAKPGFTLRIDGINVADTAGKPFISNVNGIAFTKDQNYFYYRAINQTMLYRLPAEFLGDPRYKDYELSTKIETIAETGVCHGMIADRKGNIYLSNSPEHEIQYVSPDKKVHVLVKDPRIIWPDSFGIGSDGYLYFTCSQINRMPKYNSGIDKTDYPYLLFRVKLPIN